MRQSETESAGVGGLLGRVLAELQRAGIVYCVLRDAERLQQLAAAGGELDLLVRPDDLPALPRLLAPLGFAALPRAGHGPHRFFAAFDRESGRWLELDVVDRIHLGRPPILRTELGAACLAHRSYRAPAFVPAPEEELVALLLHALLDKGRFDLPRRARLEALRLQVRDGGRVDELLAAYGPRGLTWARLAQRIQEGELEDLLAEAPALAARLAGRDRLGTWRRRLAARAARVRARAGRLLRPRTPTVALLAPDGAGKSTLAQALRASFPVPVRPVYLGLYGRDASAGRLLLPGFAGRLLRVWTRWAEARWFQGRGALVVFDRHPFDARLDAGRPLGPLKRARRWLLGHACPRPDLTLVLDAPAPVLFRRKREHDVPSLERQRRAYLQLAGELPRAIVVDAAGDAESVRRDVVALIWDHWIGARGAEVRP